jgi:hypothetical protein
MKEKITDEILKTLNKEDAEVDSEYALFVHFSSENFNEWSWCDIYQEGLRVFNLIYDTKVEDETVLSDLFAAMCAQAQDSAFYAICAALGVSSEALIEVVSDWLENQHNLPKPITIKEFGEKIEKMTLELQEN